MSWTWSQKEVSLKVKSRRGDIFVIMLEHDQALIKIPSSFCITLSASDLFLKIKRSLWSPKFFIWKPLRVHQISLKVHATASMFKALLVRNLANIENSYQWCFFVSWKWSPSLSERYKRFQPFVMPSMVKRKEKQIGERKEKKNEYTYCFLETWEKHFTSPRGKLVTVGNKKLASLGRDCSSIA